MKRKDELNKLREDEHYYGKFGKQFLSNSDISTLLTNPLALGKPMKPIPAFLVGGYFHTAILCLLYTSPSPRDRQKSRMPSSA